MIFGAVFLVALLLWIALSRAFLRDKPAPKSDVYPGLRMMALTANREKLAIPAPASPKAPWGIVMDWGVHNGTVTIVTFSDGHASVYLSSGGGFLGGEGQKEIREAAQRCVSVSADFIGELKPTKQFPLPSQGEVIFYALTGEGVLTAKASQNELMNGRHPLSKLANTMQEVITQYRLLQERQPTNH